MEFPIHLFDDFYLNKANSNQRNLIRKRIIPVFSLMLFRINKYETDFIAKDDGYTSVDLNEDDFNYFVIEYELTSKTKLLNWILSLSKLNISILLEVDLLKSSQEPKFSTPSIKYHQLKTLNYFNDSSLEIPFEKTIVTNESIMEIQKLFDSLNRINLSTFSIIDKAISDFISIREISIQSPFRVLSYFSILELLLTSYKRGGANDSSLSNQLQKKIKLINNLVEDKIDFHDYFQGADSNSLETIIEKLYQFRNNIAHGNYSDFEKEFKIIKQNGTQVIPFLHELLRTILIVAIQNPQLIYDLKEC